MSCDDKKQAFENGFFDLEKAAAASDAARRKLENRLKAAGATCAIGALGSVVGNLPGLIAGGGACIGALLVADDAAAEYEKASKLHDIAARKNSKAFLQYFLCMRRHELGEPPVS
ncbi:MAG: hypothetical protein H6712_24310 [Myxococcales bacterium]|nr:hypothetical protein [Myxococcales bacterium]